MANDLEIKIGASVDGLKSALKDAGKEVKKFGEKTEDSAKGTRAVGKASIGTSSNIRNLTSALRGGSASMEDIAEAGLDVADEMGGMSNAAGKLSGALTAGLVVALATAAVFLIKYAFRLSEAAIQSEKLRAATKKLIGSAQSELSVMNALLSVAKDESRSKQDRQRAINKLNADYKEYLPNLTTENISTKEVTKSINKYSDALIRQAKIKGLQSRLSDLFAKRYDEENKSIEENTSLIDKSIGFILGLTGTFGNLSKQQFLAAQGSKKFGGAISEIDDEIKKLTGSLKAFISEDITKKGVFTNAIRARVQSVVDEGFLLKNVIKKQLKELGDLTTDTGLSFSLVPTPEKMTGDELRLMQHMLRINEALSTFEDAAEMIIGGGIANTFAGLGEAIGDGLATGGSVLKSAGNALLAGLGGILVDLGKMSIKIGVGLLAVKLALKSLNPAIAIAGGIALVALGKSFSSKAGNISKSIGGGGGGGVAGGGSGGSSPRSSTRSGGGGFDGGRVVFEIAGQKLVGVLSNTLSRNRALGGSLTIG